MVTPTPPSQPPPTALPGIVPTDPVASASAGEDQWQVGPAAGAAWSVSQRARTPEPAASLLALADASLDRGLARELRTLAVSVEQLLSRWADQAGSVERDRPQTRPASAHPAHPAPAAGPAGTPMRVTARPALAPSAVDRPGPEAVGAGLGRLRACLALLDGCSEDLSMGPGLNWHTGTAEAATGVRGRLANRLWEVTTELRQLGDALDGPGGAPIDSARARGGSGGRPSRAADLRSRCRQVRDWLDGLPAEA